MKTIGIVTFLAVQLFAQNPVIRQGASPSGDVDFSSARTTKPVRTGGTLPGACAANEMFFLTNVGLHQCVKGKFSAVGNGGTWGTVGGTIAAQTDLWNTLQNKQPLLVGTPSQYVRGDGSLGSLAGTYEPVDAGILRSGSTYVNPSWTKFMSGGSGAVARTVASKLSDVASVKDYGAVGDGTTNDTAAIQAAHNAVCAAGGGDLLYPAGTYLISPRAGSAVGTFLICSNMHVTLAAGAKVLVKPNAGDYFSLYLPTTPSTLVDNFAMSGPGIVDQNIYLNTTSSIVPGSSTSQQSIVAVYNGSNFRVNGMRFMISGVNSIIANGTSISGVDISSNHFTFQKRAGQGAFDNSAIYISGTDWHVNNNTFTTTLADASATAIEIHMGIGNVVGNTTNMYSTAMNVVDTVGAMVSGNTMTNAASCITLWSSTLQTNTNVSGNSCSINNVDRQLTESVGIGTKFLGEAVGSFSNLSLVNNVVIYQKETAARTVVYGSYMGISLSCMGAYVTNAVVKDNLIVNAPVRGIDISITTLFTNVTVQNNVIVDAGSNISPLANAYSTAINYGSNGTNVNISNNIIRFTSNPFIGLNSLYIYGTGSILNRVYVYGNLVTAVNGTPGSYYDPQVIKNSPLIATVASTGSYGDLLNKPTMASTTAILKGDGLGGVIASAITDDGTTLAVSGRTLSVGTTVIGTTGVTAPGATLITPLAPASGGVGGMLNVPPRLRFLGDGSEGAMNCNGTIVGGSRFFTTFTVSAGNTCTSLSATAPVLIYATGACTLAGTLVGAGPGNGGQGDLGGTGGGGGGGSAAGSSGQASSFPGQFGGTVVGAAGGGGGLPGGSGNSSIVPDQLNHFVLGIGPMVGGSKAGLGGGASNGGRGGPAIMLACGSINFTGVISAAGLPGGGSTGNGIGAGGGGGGGYIWLIGRDSVINTGTINVSGGLGGSCFAFTTCGAGGKGGDGWSKVAVMQ